LSIANENFLKLEGSIKQLNSSELKDFDVKIVLDETDSSITHFEKSSFEVWLPANRTAKVYFIKEGYITSFALIDASFIPSFAYKKKKEIGLIVSLEPVQKDKTIEKFPFVKATFKANENKFILNYPKTSRSNKPFRAPFNSPADTYKNARPTVNNLDLTKVINTEKTKGNHQYSGLIEGILFAEMGYCIFNERIGNANNIISRLSEINKEEWSNVKPFDSPEYGYIISRTLNNEKSRDSLFALGSWIGTSRLLFQNFTSASKVILHNKKLKNFLKVYKASNLTDDQKLITNQIFGLSEIMVEIDEAFMYGIRNKAPINLPENELFIDFKSRVDAIYNAIIS
jgi:hypothetical protein